MSENEEEQSASAEEEESSTEETQDSSEASGVSYAEDEDGDGVHKGDDQGILGESASTTEDEGGSGNAVEGDDDDVPIEECFSISEEVLVDAPGVILSSSGERLSKDSGVVVKSIDFRNPAFLGKDDIRNISERYKDFAGYLSARLALLLRADVKVRLKSIKAMLYGAFTESISGPTHISLFRFDGLRGIGLCELKTSIAKVMVDRVLGGKGTASSNDKPLTEIEAVLIGDVVQQLLEEWCAQWSSPEPLNPLIIGSETCGQFLQTSVHDALMLVATLKLTVGKVSEDIQLTVPYGIVDQLARFSSKGDSKAEPSPSKGLSTTRWIPGYEEIAVPVTAYWDAFTLPVGDLLQMRAGDIVELPKSILSQTKVQLSGSTRFLGEVGVEEGHVAVKITQSLE